MVRRVILVLVLISLTACGQTPLPLTFPPSVVSPSATPAIISPTPKVLPVATIASSASQTFTETPPKQTGTPTPPPSTSSPLPLPATASPTPEGTAEVQADLQVQIADCNTGIDITHGMGKVTNAFPLIQNYGPADLSQVCATLSANEEGRPHPDKTKCVPSLPSGFQVVLKLTVDTSFGQEVNISVNITSLEKATALASRIGCGGLALPGWSPEDVGIVQPIP